MADVIIDMPDDPNNQVIKIDNNVTAPNNQDIIIDINVTAPNEQVINIDNHIIDPIDQYINIDNQETAPNEQVTGLNINNNEPDKTIDEHDRTMDHNANEIEGNEEIIDEDNRAIEHEGTIDELDAEQGGEVPDRKRKLRCNRKMLIVGLLVALEFLLLSAVPATVLYFIMANPQEQMRAELQQKVEELSTAWNNTKIMEEENRQLKLKVEKLSTAWNNTKIMEEENRQLKLKELSTAWNNTKLMEEEIGQLKLKVEALSTAWNNTKLMEEKNRQLKLKELSTAWNNTKLMEEEIGQLKLKVEALSTAWNNTKLMEEENRQLKLKELSTAWNNTKLMEEEIRQFKLKVEELSTACNNTKLMEEENRQLKLKVEKLSTAWNNTKLMEEENRQLKLQQILSLENNFTLFKDRERWRLLFRNEKQTSVELAEQNKRMRSILSSNTQSFIWGFCDSTTLQCSRCIPGWTEFNGRCFHLSQEEKNWNNARRKCLEFGGDLAIVRDAKDQALLTNMTLQYRQQHPNSNFLAAWIGLQDKIKEGRFFWVNGRRLTYHLKYWKVGEPNNIVAWWKEDNTGQDCVAIAPPKSAGGNDWLNNWDDIVCMGERHYICETKALILT